MNHNKNWINFVELRKQLVFSDVLAYYKVNLQPKGQDGQHVGRCPLPSHRDQKGNTFSANYEKGLFQCFGCKETGNVIDFAVLMEGENKKDGKAVRGVALWLREKFVDKSPSKPEPERTPAAEKAATEEDSGGADLPIVYNQPLDFELKTLDSEHPYFAEQKLSAETVARFGLGFCNRGFLSGRIATPLCDDAGELIGYAGLAVNDTGRRTGDPRYLFPASREHDGVLHVFDPCKFLYNGYRVGKGAKDLIVVRDCHTVWHLLQGGFPNVVALMGDDCSEDQAALIPLLTADTARIWLLTDSSVASENTGQTFLPQVASSRLCRWLKVAKEQEIAPDHPLLRALPRR
jgi:DNA primase